MSLEAADVGGHEALRCRFTDMQPMFKNTHITRADIGPFMRRYADEHDLLMQQECALVCSFHDDNILITTPLLKWHLVH